MHNVDAQLSMAQAEEDCTNHASTNEAQVIAQPPAQQQDQTLGIHAVRVSTNAVLLDICIHSGLECAVEL